MTLNLRKGDWEEIERIYAGKIYTSQVIRTLVANFVDKLRASHPVPDVTLDEKDYNIE